MARGLAQDCGVWLHEIRPGGKAGIYLAGSYNIWTCFVVWWDLGWQVIKMGVGCGTG